ncbi:MAG: site-2 protease family protein [Candidatus Wallbacteria bacterium HGW-Wallbacteria-1]|jgi:Zn-dependent protease|uniref:Site-2 protease family protein n=1 Tax=Candidatus Wallbacteria bacterium HGW-Wallbacteria-1 TaxID=2013854 RepID=A0A2N1PRK8_9BACT|nr:MAG: site-2 protease family protein [Candidatus Wallbacteria bacterium HGW-Wallbacteria-1]
MIINAILHITMFAIAATFHELAHAWAAHKCGDDTSKNQGRITLNPLAHIDPFGTVIIPLTLALSGANFIFGWAKPVEYNPYNLRDRREDEYLIAIAGPVANFLQALAGSITIAVLAKFGIISTSSMIFTLGILYINTNVVLGVFNLLPVPPLDGFKVLKFILPESMEQTFDSIESIGSFILLFLVISGGLSSIIGPIMGWFQNIYVGLIFRILRT